VRRLRGAHRATPRALVSLSLSASPQPSSFPSPARGGEAGPLPSLSRPVTPPPLAGEGRVGAHGVVDGLTVGEGATVGVTVGTAVGVTVGTGVSDGRIPVSIGRIPVGAGAGRANGRTFGRAIAVGAGPTVAAATAAAAADVGVGLGDRVGLGDGVTLAVSSGDEVVLVATGAR
jgi:hypothetical protein